MADFIGGVIVGLMIWGPGIYRLVRRIRRLRKARQGAGDRD